MKRLLLTASGVRCPFRCSYCFANFEQYERPLTLEQLEKDPALAHNIDILYPACDIDLFAMRDPLSLLRRTAQFGKSISVSTKSRLHQPIVQKLADLAIEMFRKRLILKISVSFATSNQIATFEPGTADYEARLANLSLLKKYEIPRSVVLKPLLPTIPTSEYLQIVQDTSPMVDLYLLGDTYIDQRELPNKKGLEANMILPHPTIRRVNWAFNEPLWPVYEMTSKRQEIVQKITQVSASYYESDLSLMKYLILTM